MLVTPKFNNSSINEFYFSNSWNKNICDLSRKYTIYNIHPLPQYRIYNIQYTPPASILNIQYTIYTHYLNTKYTIYNICLIIQYIIYTPCLIIQYTIYTPCLNTKYTIYNIHPCLNIKYTIYNIEYTPPVSKLFSKRFSLKLYTLHRRYTFLPPFAKNILFLPRYIISAHAFFGFYSLNSFMKKLLNLWEV